MAKPFKGTINIDIRDSVPDWEPYTQPKAPEGSPNVLFIVWDDVGFGAMEPFGGLIETPVLNRLAENGLRYTQFHTTALCSPTRAAMLTGRNHRRLVCPALLRRQPVSRARTAISPSRLPHSQRCLSSRATTLRCWENGIFAPRTRPTWLPPSAIGPLAAVSNDTTVSWVVKRTNSILTWCRTSSSLEPSFRASR